MTGFNVEVKVYVIDYGTGSYWSAMQGVHGPYASLDDYQTYLASLNLKGFAAESVKWRGLAGRED